MFSGLTNQVSSWMGGPAKKEGDPQNLEEETVPSPMGDIDASSNADGDKKDVSPTKAGGSKLEMLSNVKGQMSSWISTGITGIQGLRRNEETVPDPIMPPATDAGGGGGGGGGMSSMGSMGGMSGGLGAGDAAAAVESPASEKSVKGSPVEQKEDDDSSATGGADSDVPASEPGTPGEEKDGAGGPIGGVSTKALQGAKSIGSFLFSAVNKAGKTVTEATTKIKKSVEENSLLGEFNKEQEAFIKEKHGKGTEAAVPPWVGCPNEESLKEEFLTLSTDRRNFVRSPPAGVEFHFDYDTCYPVAMATLAEDPNLEKMRFDLVPKVISEETFWRNYFYRVSLIRQANELSSMAQEGAEPTSRTTSMEGEPAVKPDVLVPEQAPTDSPTHEFVSDTFHASTSDIEEVREGLKKLGMDPDKRNEEEWEKELEAELQDYEVVADGDNNTNQDTNWETQIDEMLDEEEPCDLK